jgi:hypothetical protein
MWTSSNASVRRAKYGSALLIVVLAWVVTSHGEAIPSAQTDLAQTERKLAANRERVAVTAELVSTSQSLRTAREWVLHACQASYAAVEKLRHEAEKAEELVRIDAAAAEKLARAATLALERSRTDADRAGDHILDQPFRAYNIVQRGTLTFNAITGAVDLRLDEGPGIKLRAGDLEAILAGRFQPDGADPREMAAQAFAIRASMKHNYNEVRAGLAAKHGAGNVYMLSRRFLEWASVERLSGIAVDNGAVEPCRQLQLEFEDFSAWLRLKGINDLGPAPSAFFLELVRTGSYAPLGLTVKTVQIDCTNSFEQAGSTDVPVDLLKRLRPNSNIGPRTAWQTVEKRPVIAVIWSGATAGQESLAAHLERDFRLSAPSIDDLRRRLPTPVDPRIRRLVNWTAGQQFTAINTSTGLRRLARASLGLRKEDFESSTGTSVGIVDLRQSDFAEIVAPIVNQLTLGNSKSSELDMLELDLSSGRLDVGFTLHHRHIWPSLRAAEAQLRATFGPVGTGLTDLAAGRPDTAYESACKRYNEADLKAREASAKHQDACRKVREAADRVASKRLELSTLASDLSRARSDLRNASLLETQARQEAQAACVEMTELDAQVRIARNKLNGPGYSFPPHSLARDDKASSKK